MLEMRPALYFFSAVAACGLLLSIAANVMSLAGGPIPFGGKIIGLHLGIFLVWLPAVLLLQQSPFPKDRRRIFNAVKLGNSPWVWRALIAISIYGGLCFLSNFLGIFGKTSGMEKGSGVASVFSGHWMIFYSIALAVFTAALRSPDLFRHRRCPEGHEVMPGARFCPSCGKEVELPPG